MDRSYMTQIDLLIGDVWRCCRRRTPAGLGANDRTCDLVLCRGHPMESPQRTRAYPVAVRFKPGSRNGHG